MQRPEQGAVSLSFRNLGLEQGMAGCGEAGRGQWDFTAAWSGVPGSHRGADSCELRREPLDDFTWEQWSLISLFQRLGGGVGEGSDGDCWSLVVKGTRLGLGLGGDRRGSQWAYQRVRCERQSGAGVKDVT